MVVKSLAYFVLFVYAIAENGALGAHHGEKRMKALTYNTALFDYSKLPNVANNRDQRLQATINALRDSEADVVCLQEVWIGQDVAAIVNQLSSVFQYSYSPLHTASGVLQSQSGLLDTPCDRQILVNLDSCSLANGCDVPDREAGAQCLAINCPIALAAAFSRQSCTTCIAISGPNSTAVIERCSADVSPTLNPPTMNTKGLVLLSKMPMSGMKTVGFYDAFPIKIADRGFLEAKIGMDLTVVCTHLTSVPEVFYPPPQSPEPLLSTVYPSYAAQNQHEVSVMIEMYKDVSPVLLMGDFNIGIGFHRGLVSILPRTYKTLVHHFDAHRPSRQCTFCDATMNVYNAGETSKSIDHIFGKGVGIVGTRVAFKDAFVTDITGMNLPLSDHFGFEVTFVYPRFCTADNRFN